MTVLLSRVAQGQIDKLPTVVKARMFGLFERLQRWPNVSGAKPLRGKMSGCFRMRTGDYRVLFRIEGRTVLVEQVGHRDRFYEG